jgi:hypothetical protein
MTKVQTFRCDRCGTDFTKDVDDLQSKVMLEDHDIAWDLKVDENTSDLCADCLQSFYDWRNHNEDVDKFITSKQKEWVKAEEET